MISILGVSWITLYLFSTKTARLLDNIGLIRRKKQDESRIW